MIMRHDVRCEFPAGYDGTAVLERLGRVLDPELDEPILGLGFVRAVALRSGHAEVALQLPTAWCAVNFTYLMAEDVRRALLELDDVSEVTIRLGDHCAAAEIEAAVNRGAAFADAFPGEGAGSLAALRLGFLRKGFLIRQERLLRQLRDARLSPAMICGLRLGDVSADGDRMLVGRPDRPSVVAGPAAVWRRYLQRRGEIGLDCGHDAPLIVDLDGEPISAERLADHYEAARTMRVALEANGSFCRALMTRAAADAVETKIEAREGSHVPP